MEEMELLPDASLTDKQKRFCDEYLIDLNATAAARRAGYAEAAANQMGFENLNKPLIQKYIQDRQQQIKDRLHITQERVLQEYARIAFADIRKFYNEKGELLLPHQLDEETAAALASFDVEDGTTKIRTHNKLAALESIGKHLGFFEKDNDQTKPTGIFLMKVEMIDNGVPLAGSEKDILI